MRQENADVLIGQQDQPGADGRAAAIVHHQQTAVVRGLPKAIPIPAWRLMVGKLRRLHLGDALRGENGRNVNTSFGECGLKNRQSHQDAITAPDTKQGAPHSGRNLSSLYSYVADIVCAA